MSIALDHGGPPGGGLIGLRLQAFGCRLRAAWEAILRAAAERRAEAELCALGEHRLRDIGLGRSEIGSLGHAPPHCGSRLRRRRAGLARGE